jgi:hypothetical protein
MTIGRVFEKMGRTGEGRCVKDSVEGMVTDSREAYGRER